MAASCRSHVILGNASFIPSYTSLMNGPNEAACFSSPLKHLDLAEMQYSFTSDTSITNVNRNVGFPLQYIRLVFWSFFNAESSRDEVTKHSNSLDSDTKTQGEQNAQDRNPL
ncbi:hypothetical protein VNO80_02276 [Phaseolus coccineus]|uniref:Uncharacterized protein n=1 Tax=Phaseolus coccineus TaxID=3886 RepID=A0AAN9NP49_PHACN